MQVDAFKKNPTAMLQYAKEYAVECNIDCARFIEATAQFERSCHCCNRGTALPCSCSWRFFCLSGRRTNFSLTLLQLCLYSLLGHLK